MLVQLDHHHEQFAQEVVRRLSAGVEQRVARIEAYQAAGFQSKTEVSLEANARRLANRPGVRTRISELQQRAATIAQLDAGWALVQLAKDHEELGNFNVANYLGDVDSEGNRPIDLTETTEGEMALLSEFSTETTIRENEDGEVTRTIRTRVKGPSDKFGQRRAIVETMARIAGWSAPTKISATTPDGKESAPLVTFETMVLAVAARQEQLRAVESPALAPPQHG